MIQDKNCHQWHDENAMFEANYLLIKHLLSTVFCTGLFGKKGLSSVKRIGSLVYSDEMIKANIVMELR